MKLTRRIVLTAAAMLGIGGGALSVAAVNGQLQLWPSRSPMAATHATSFTINGMAPGDGAQRLITVTNTSRRAVTRMAVRVPRGTSPLTRSSRGLMAQLLMCTKPWTRLPTRGPSYKCTGHARTIVQFQRLPIDRNQITIPRTAPGKKLYFRFTLLLRRDAGNALQGQRARVTPTILIGTP